MAFDHRPFQPEDARHICAFFRSPEELFFFLPKAAFPLAPGALTTGIANSLSPTVAVTGDKLAGYVDLQEVKENRYCAIGRLVVDPALRRQGAARFLVRTMIDQAVARHQAKFVRAACYSHNTPAYALLHDMGFRPDDMVPQTNVDGDSILLVNLMIRCRRSRG